MTHLPKLTPLQTSILTLLGRCPDVYLQGCCKVALTNELKSGMEIGGKKTTSGWDEIKGKLANQAHGEVFENGDKPMSNRPAYVTSVFMKRNITWVVEAIFNMAKVSDQLQ